MGKQDKPAPAVVDRTTAKAAAIRSVEFIGFPFFGVVIGQATLE